MNQSTQNLEDYVSNNYDSFGFIIPVTPTQSNIFLELEQKVPQLIKEGQIRSIIIAQLPENGSALVEGMTQNDLLVTKRAIATIAQAYVWGEGNEKKVTVLPAKIAKPLLTAAQKLNEPPILTYADYVLRNSSVSTLQQRPISVPTYRAESTFTGNKSEHGFVGAHIVYELEAAKIIPFVASAVNASIAKDSNKVLENLKKIGETLPKLRQQFLTVNANTDPAFFSRHIRQYLNGWKEIIPNMIYEGTTCDAGNLGGETGSQSSVIPMLDTMVGAFEHGPMARNTPYGEFREYMPSRDRAFLENIATKGDAVRNFVIASKDVQLTSCIQYLYRWYCCDERCTFE